MSSFIATHQRLSRYVVCLYLAFYTMTLSIITLLLVLVAMAEKAGTLTRNPHGWVAGWQLAGYFAMETAMSVLPLASFLAIVCLGNFMSRRGELLALAIIGLSARAVKIPILMIAVLVAGLAYMVGEVFMPQITASRLVVEYRETYHQDLRHQILTRPSLFYIALPYLLYLPERGDIAYTFSNVQIFYLQKGLPIEVWQAGQLKPQANNQWQLNSVYHVNLLSQQSHFVKQLQLPLPVGPKDLWHADQDPQLLPTAALNKLLQRRQRSSLSSAPHALMWYQRLAAPLALVACTLLALPQALNRVRQGTLAVVLTQAVALLAVITVSSSTLQSLALAHQAPLWLGGMAMPIVALICISIRSFWGYMT